LASPVHGCWGASSRAAARSTGATRIEKLTYVARLKRVKFGKISEQLNAEQKALFDEPWMPTLPRSRIRSKTPRIERHPEHENPLRVRLRAPAHR
jgi:hypothetical protein